MLFSGPPDVGTGVKPGFGPGKSAVWKSADQESSSPFRNSSWFIASYMVQQCSAALFLRFLPHMFGPNVCSKLGGGLTHDFIAIIRGGATHR